jgi:hypothetical protein
MAHVQLFQPRGLLHGLLGHLKRKFHPQ